MASWFETKTVFRGLRNSLRNLSSLFHCTALRPWSLGRLAREEVRFNYRIWPK